MKSLSPHRPHVFSSAHDVPDPGLPGRPELRKVRLDHFLLDWRDPADPSASPPFARIAHLVPGSFYVPTYFQMMRLVELTFGPTSWPVRKRQMEQALAAYYREIGYACLTRLDRGWYGNPTAASRTQCNGALAFGHTHFREPVSFLTALNPALDVSDWDPWRCIFER